MTDVQFPSGMDAFAGSPFALHVRFPWRVPRDQVSESAVVPAHKAVGDAATKRHEAQVAAMAEVAQGAKAAAEAINQGLNKFVVNALKEKLARGEEAE